MRVRRAGLRRAAQRRRLKRRSSSGYLARLAKQTDREPVDAELKLRNLRPVAKKSAPGRRLMQVIASQQLSLAIRKHERSRSRCRYEVIEPEGDRERTSAQLIVIKRDSSQLLFYNGRQAEAHLPGRDRPVVVPDADRQLRDHQQAARPVVVPARRTPPGRRARSRCRPARGTRSARAGWASPRRTSASTARRTRLDRLLGLARLRAHADPAGRVAVRACRRRHARVHRQGVTGSARPKRVGQAHRARAGVAALLGLLVWKVAFGNDGGAAAELARGKSPCGARRSRSTGSTGDGHAVDRRPPRARPSSSTSGPRGASRAATRRRSSQQTYERYRDAGPRRARRSTSNDFRDGRATLHGPVRADLPDRVRRQGLDRRASGASAASRRRSSSTARASSSASGSPGAGRHRAQPRRLRARHRARARRDAREASRRARRSRRGRAVAARRRRRRRRPSPPTSRRSSSARPARRRSTSRTRRSRSG